MDSHLDILRQADGTFYEDKLCTCTTTGYHTDNPVKINPTSDVMPEPPPCAECGGIPWMYFRQGCCNCKKPFYRWFQIPMQLFTGDACFDCTVTKAQETFGVMWDHNNGAIAPHPSTMLTPPTAAELASKLDDLFAGM